MTPSFRALQVADTPRLQQADTRDLKLAGQFRYLSRISTNSGAVTAAGEAIPVGQDAFATFDLLGSLRVVDHVRASVNLRNVTNAKYRGTLKYRQAFSLPRAASWRRCASIIEGRRGEAVTSRPAIGQRSSFVASIAAFAARI